MTALCAQDLAATIAELARRPLPADAPRAMAAELRMRRLRPIVYMRYAEFDALLPEIDFAAGMEVVDFSSPQWFTLALARHFPDTRFTYTNVTDEELAACAALAAHFGLANLRYEKADLRRLPFADGRFDRAVSISVVEHVYPEVGGDVQAMNEIRRVLAPGGKLFLTVPCKARRNVVTVNRAVYERGAAERNFYAREYDLPQFEALLAESGFVAASRRFIVERPGLLALDALEWGPQRGSAGARLVLRSRRLLEKLSGKSLDGWLARRHLQVSREPQERLVNIAATLCSARAPGGHSAVR